MKAIGVITKIGRKII